MHNIELEKIIRQDCLASLDLQPELATRLDKQKIAIVGGTGFVGTWIAEVVAALNDEKGGGIHLDLFGRSAAAWTATHPHLASRKDVSVRSIDVRTSFEISKDTTLVLYAAGVADPRVHASDPLRVHETALHGMLHTLAASARLQRLRRFVNLSSGLVLGACKQNKALNEGDIQNLDFTRVHNVYAESRRAAESLVALYASQYRIPTCTARAFTFLGPYQQLDAPWAANSFMRDALSGSHIRLDGDGSTHRSYLYGSDAACWLLRILIDGQDGEVYNLGGMRPVSHGDIAKMIAACISPPSEIVYKNQPLNTGRFSDFYPDLTNIQTKLGLMQAFEVEEAVKRTMHWNATNIGRLSRLNKVTSLT